MEFENRAIQQFAPIARAGAPGLVPDVNAAEFGAPVSNESLILAQSERWRRA